MKSLSARRPSYWTGCSAPLEAKGVRSISEGRSGLSQVELQDLVQEIRDGHLRRVAEEASEQRAAAV
jgi:hypothetical protein